MRERPAEVPPGMQRCVRCLHSFPPGEFFSPVTGNPTTRCQECLRYQRAWDSRNGRGPARSEHCECGNEKRDFKDCCSVCEWRDGVGPGGGHTRAVAEREVMLCMYEVGGPITVNDVVEESGLAWTNVHRAFGRLIAKGRIREVEPHWGSGSAEGGRLYVLGRGDKLPRRTGQVSAAMRLPRVEAYEARRYKLPPGKLAPPIQVKCGQCQTVIIAKRRELERHSKTHGSRPEFTVMPEKKRKRQWPCRDCGAKQPEYRAFCFDCAGRLCDGCAPNHGEKCRER